MDLKLSGLSALVTGASKGIGFGVAEALLREGCNVVISSSSAENLSSALKKLEKLGLSGRISSQVIDVSDPRQAEREVRLLQSKGITFDILVANGPGPIPQTATAVALDELQRGLDSNLLSMVQLAQSGLSKMVEQKFGRIVFLSSSTAKEPDAGMVVSNVARAGLLSYAKTLSREVAKDNVTVNTILTGAVLTDRCRSLIERDAVGQGISFQAALGQAEASIPMGRISSPEEFAQLIVFLCSPLASYLTGASFWVDGGLSRGL